MSGGLSGTIFDPKNRRILTEFFDKTLFRCGYESLSLILQKVEQSGYPAVIEFGIKIIEKKERIFAPCSVIYGDVCQLKYE